MDHLIEPHGGVLRDLIVSEERSDPLKAESGGYASITLSQRQLCDLELLMNGGFSPLTGFMTRAEYESVLADLHLPDGTLWPLPITLEVPAPLAEKLQNGQRLALRDGEGFMLAVLTVQDVWRPDKHCEADAVFGTTDLAHPGVRYLFEQVHDCYVGGTLEGVQLPSHYDFETLRNTPGELRHLFDRRGWRRVVAFHTCKPMHRLHREITMRAAKEVKASILIHPTVGMTRPGDLYYFARVRCYQALRRHYPHDLAMISLLPSAERMAGPREAVLNAIIRQNYGCSHIIIGPDHAAPPNVREHGPRFYPTYASQELVARNQKELKIQMVAVKEMAYVSANGHYMEMEKIQKDGLRSVQFTMSDLMRSLSHGLDLPSWLSYPDVVDELRKVILSRRKQGITLFFTGLSGSGKSTLAKIIFAKFIEEGSRPVSLLDGDIVRQHLSSELGFSKVHRDLNVRRIGFVASEITKNGGVAICAPIAPYAATRHTVREMIEVYGAFIEIHVATPLEVCESRDRKGLYAKARKGIIPEFTGVSDPYDVPQHPEMRIDTTDLTPMQAAQEVFLYLLSEGYLDDDGSDENGATQ